jgi:hypothetical protein
MQRNILQFNEPALPDVADEDKMNVRNVLYTAWFLQSDGELCASWQVHNKPDGYLVIISLGNVFSVSSRDLQAIYDVCPLRIDAITVRNTETAASSAPVKGSGAVIAIKILDHNQMVKITETDVVRIKKRHRGWFS